MANTLTWRDVAAPDFSTALRGFDLAGRNVSQGFDTLNQALGGFQSYQKEQAASAVLNNAAGFSDPEKLRAAIADGSLFGGIDRSLVTPQTLAALNVQPGILLNQGVEQERLNQAKVIDPLLVQDQTLRNQHLGISNAYDTAANPLKLTGLALGNAQTAASTDSTIANTANTRQGTAQSATTFGESQDAYRAEQAAIPFLNQLKTKVNSPDDVQTMLASPEFLALPPMAQAKVLATAQGSLSGSPVAGAPAGKAIAGAAGTAAGRPEDAAFGFVPTSTPLSQQTIGGVLNTQKNEIAPTNKGGNTPAGAFQINYDTLKDYAPKVLGSDWDKQTFTLENQEKIAHALFDARKDGDLSQTWSSLPNRGVGGYKDVSWDQMKPLIFRGEVGRDPSQSINEELFNLKNTTNQYGARVGAASNAINSALSQTNANNINLKYPTTQADTDTTTGALVAKMTAKDSTSSYKLLPPSRLTKEIEDIKQRVPGTTSATAAAILEAHPQGAGFIARHLQPWAGGYDNIPNEEGINNELTKLNSGDANDGVKANNAALAIQSQIQSAGKDYNDAALELGKALHNRSLTSEQIDGYRNKANQARAVLEAKLKEQKADDTLNFQPNNPTAGAKAGANLPKAGVDTPTATQAIDAATRTPAPVVAPVVSPFAGGASAVPGYQAPAGPTPQDVANYRAQRQAALSGVLGGGSALPPAVPVGTSTPATKAIQVASVPSNTDLKAAQAQADAAYEAMIAADKRNDPQRAKFQDAYEQADRALNNLQALSKRR